MTARYALYFAPPPDSALWRFGCSVLAYDAATGEDVPPLIPEGIPSERFQALTEEPRLYGFHATLKAPFRLADGVSEAELVAGLEAFAQGRRVFALETLSVTALGPFVALMEPGSPARELVELEQATVEAFERFRAPLTSAEIARRRPEGLSPRQRDQLARVGYPYVFEDFRFHMTLTGRLAADEVEPFRSKLAALHAEAVPPGPVPVDALALFRQAAPGERFRLLARARLGA